MKRFVFFLLPCFFLLQSQQKPEPFFTGYKIFEIPVSRAPKTDQSYFGGGSRVLPGIVIIPFDKGYFLAWNDANNVNITRYEKTTKKTDSILTFHQARLAGFAGDKTGFAVALQIGEKLYLNGFDHHWNKVFSQLIIGDKNRSEYGSKFDPMKFGSSRLILSGNKYYLYFAHHQQWGQKNSNNVHQGDMLVSIEKGGENYTILKSWGVSHSLDQRIMIKNDTVITAALGDAYPKALLIKKDQNIQKIQGVTSSGNGYANAWLGGLFDFNGKIGISFSTNQNNPEGPYLIGFGFYGEEITYWPLESNLIGSVSKCKGAVLGNYLLLGMRVGQSYGILVDKFGKLKAGPHVLPMGFTNGDDWINIQGGNVAWAYSEHGKKAIKIIEINKPDKI